MLSAIHPKLPMRHQGETFLFYTNQLGFARFGHHFDGYLMVQRDDIQIHFFAHPSLDPLSNYGQAYIRTNNTQEYYDFVTARGVKASPPQLKPWGVIEFSLLDPDHNLLTFGQTV
jgi:hypothetical protein